MNNLFWKKKCGWYIGWAQFLSSVASGLGLPSRWFHIMFWPFLHWQLRFRPTWHAPQIIGISPTGPPMAHIWLTFLEVLYFWPQITVLLQNILPRNVLHYKTSFLPNVLPHNVLPQNVLPQNVHLLYKTSSSTKRPSTKRPQIQNVLHYKTSFPTKNIYI